MKLPADHLVLFDGVCALCTGTVQFLLRHDRSGRLHFAPLQSDLGRRICLLNDLNPEQFDTFIYARQDQPALTRSDAALAIASFLGGPWKLLGLLRLIPRRLRDAVYSIIARNRHRWFGRHETCHLPTAAERPRFHS